MKNRKKAFYNSTTQIRDYHYQKLPKRRYFYLRPPYQYVVQKGSGHAENHLILPSEIRSPGGPLFRVLPFSTVSVSGSCCNKAPEPGRLRNGTLFLTVLEEAASSTPVWLGSGEERSPSRMKNSDFSLCPHTVEGRAGLSGVPFRGILIPFVRAVPS